MAGDASDTQKQTTDLRLKYFDIYRQKLNAQAAGRFWLIDDYITTALRLQLLDHLPMIGGSAEVAATACGSGRAGRRTARP